MVVVGRERFSQPDPSRRVYHTIYRCANCPANFLRKICDEEADHNAEEIHSDSPLPPTGGARVRVRGRQLSARSLPAFGGGDPNWAGCFIDPQNNMLAVCGGPCRPVGAGDECEEGDRGRRCPGDPGYYLSTPSGFCMDARWATLSVSGPQGPGQPCPRGANSPLKNKVAAFQLR